jgi:hypothetical protein
MGDPEAARRLSEDTLTRARRVFGEDHPRTRKAADTLAAALRSLRAAKPTQGTSDPTDSQHRDRLPT